MGTATVRSGSINLLNTIIGAGILAMPYGLRRNGLLFGTGLIVWSALTSAFGLYLQNKVAKYTQQQGAVSYFSLCQLTYPQLLVIFDGAIAVKCFGVGVLYLVVIGDLMPKIAESAGAPAGSVLLARNFWISVFMAAVVAPLSFLKKLDSLKYTSVVALVSVVYLICLVVEHYFADGGAADAREIDWVGPVSWRLTLTSFSIFVFAYTCHQNMFAIINELQPSEKLGLPTRQLNLIIRNAISVACLSYLVVGVLGYLTFGNAVNANIISMYPRDSVASLVGRLAIVVMVLLSFPLQCHPCRGSVNHVIHFLRHGVSSGWKLRAPVAAAEYTPIPGDTDSADVLFDPSFVSTTPMEGAQDTDGHAPIVVPLTAFRFYVITAVIVVAAYLVAISVQSLALVLAFVGATGSTLISFILPGLFSFSLIKPLDGAAVLTPLERFCKYGGLALSIWGAVVMAVCLSATLFLAPEH
ncbi:hypothetical protein METBIDRAFT_139215 [Metschnikowia bicuspidata var. bicuspidata NRRL YB-4993]|uniref:Amino acid transporter transmembrane domain-containing protein n=1 Tax=Metschnikowia bicuspidata var. bicuspidata NRRL YB-4993 TaxID=869754 RepID=A0A1A0HD20_9ASCO|nr:hypothetical protein METBIDRAFT_139215 [Metschnikowia bicuspidata var. bicuspidata NRRL YB-4993]OBA21875.1 hypothetical protein METBIDRAFT_139215 [Metschnikowia bicuspidata var. bicuspidata NRRL YB-4993]